MRGPKRLERMKNSHLNKFSKNANYLAARQPTPLCGVRIGNEMKRGNSTNNVVINYY